MQTKHLVDKVYEDTSCHSSEEDAESSVTLLENRKWKPSTRSRSQKLAIIRVILAVAVLLTCTVTLLSFAVTEHHIESLLHYNAEYGDCGSTHTVEEARAKGCVFDPMSWVWTRPECYDEELVADFLNRTDWEWHTDPKLKSESKVPLEVAIRGDYPRLFIHKKYHSIHCGYMMRKMQRALLGQPLDSYSMSEHHTKHCGIVVADDFLHEDVQCTPEMVCPTWVRATWTSCKKYT